MTEKELKEAMQAIMAQTRAETDPLSPDELLSFRAGLIADEDREKLLDRAAASPETARVLIDARRFPGVEPADERQRVTEKDIDRQWQRFQERLGHEKTSPATEVRSGRLTLSPPPSSPRKRWHPSSLLPGVWRLLSLVNSRRFAQAAAAALLLVSLGLSWSLIEQRRPVPADARPRLNLPIVELVPESEGGQRTALQLPVTAEGAFLVLTLRDQRHFPAYEVEIQDPTAAAVWSSPALRRSAEGFFTLELPRGFLPAGHYRISLWGVEGDRREPLAVYGLAIEE